MDFIEALLLIVVALATMTGIIWFNRRRLKKRAASLTRLEDGRWTWWGLDGKQHVSRQDPRKSGAWADEEARGRGETH